MKKITQKMVKEVRAHSRQAWHDSAWWAFEARKETTLIQTAMHHCGKGATIKEITTEANKR